MSNVAAFPANIKAEALATIDELRSQVESGAVGAFMYVSIDEEYTTHSRIVALRQVPSAVLIGAAAALSSLVCRKLTT